MRSNPKFACWLSLFVLCGCVNAPHRESATSAAPRTTVEFVQAERFTDLGSRRYSTARMRAYYVNELGKFISASAERILPPGQHLSVRVTDVDLAGDFEPWHRGANDMRVVRDIYPPRVDLQFRVTGSDGTFVSEGSRQLRDAAFLMTASVAFGGAELRHEKALLLTWMQSEFGFLH